MAKVAEGMTIEPKLMDPERLALIEQEESLMPVSMTTGWSVAARQAEVLAVAQLIRELRGHAKHWEGAADEADKRTVAHFEECERLRAVIEEREAERLEGVRLTHEREDLERRSLAEVLGLDPRGETVLGLLVHVRVQLSAGRLEAKRERLEGDRNRATAVDARESLLVARAEAKRYRDRCPVEASDVKAAGVTYAHLDAFSAVHGFAPARWNTPGLKRGRGASDIGWARDGVYIGDYAAWPGNRNRGWETDGVAAFVAMASTELDRPAFDILDEMAPKDPS